LGWGTGETVEQENVRVYYGHGEVGQTISRILKRWRFKKNGRKRAVFGVFSVPLHHKRQPHKNKQYETNETMDALRAA
jgi:hypothetical protein